MKYVKMLGLAAVAAMALMAFVGASSASATVLCKVTPTGSPAECSSAYGKKQVYNTKATDPILTATGAEDVTCTSSETSIEQTNAGGAAETVKGNIKTLSFTGCKTVPANISCTVTAVGLPFSGEIHKSSENHDGTVIVTNGKTQVKCAFGFLNCVFGKASLDLTLDAGNPASITTNEVELEQQEELGFEECPESSKWDATYVATSPTAIYVGDT